jgi:predicted alpha-1,6-mannanase (GH76 family)
MLLSKTVKIIQHFVFFHDGGRRHLELCQNVISNTFDEKYVTNLSGGMGWSDHNQIFCTRVHACYVMILAIFGVDTSKDVDSVRD